MQSLTACEQCDRHVKRSDMSCPFCAAWVAHQPRPRPPRPRPLSRPAALAFGAAVTAALAAACGSTSVPPGDAALTDAAVAEVADSGSDAGADSGIAVDSGGVDAGFDAGDIAPPYGAPPMCEDWV